VTYHTHRVLLSRVQPVAVLSPRPASWEIKRPFDGCLVRIEDHLVWSEPC